MLRSSIWQPQHFKSIILCEFLTKVDPILGPLIAFSRVTAKINDKNTLKVCRKIAKITDPNLGFFLGDGVNPKMKFPAEL